MRPTPTERRCPGARLIRGRRSPPGIARLERRIASEGRGRTPDTGGGIPLDDFCSAAFGGALFVSIEARVMRRCDMAASKKHIPAARPPRRVGHVIGQGHGVRPACRVHAGHTGGVLKEASVCIIVHYANVFVYSVKCG